MLLSDTQIRKAKIESKPYKLQDGQGLFVLINPNGSKYWRFRYKYQQKEYLLGLGVYPHLSLADARKMRDEAKALMAKNINPSEQRKTEKILASQDISFKAIAELWCSSNKKWSVNHYLKVKRELEIHAFPTVGHKRITEITTRELLSLLKKSEASGKSEVPLRLQQRVIAIMRYAVQHSYIDYNPAQDLSGVVATPKATHRASLPFESIAELLSRIKEYQGRELTRLAIQLSLLTFIRSSEMRFARWSEIDFERKLWVIPTSREPIAGVRFSERGAKMKSPHMVPLSRQAIDVLTSMKAISGGYELICIGDNKPSKPMSENTINKALRLMGYDTKTQLCGHGFRTMACSALVESSLWSKDAIERQMSHQERNSVRAAYIHMAQHLEERTKMMQWWADYLDTIRDSFIMPYEFKAA